MAESRPPATAKAGRIELLAPAGGLAAFFAALESGADALYCGLSSFSARARAKNFAAEDLPALVGAAHGKGARLYVALNTLIKERELPELIKTLAALAEAGVDALIVQDLGVVRLVRRHFPELDLHGSTQMTIHNAAGVNVLADLGFTRAVLARELSLTEIAAIRADSTLELEHFVHGALCFSISGRCLFSSFRSGKSGNRGRCEQLCRRRYQLSGKPGYYFSTADFSAIDLLPELSGAGVCSLKIEGRMKNAEYVGRVVKAYRLMLDAPPVARGRVLAEARELLASTYGRVATGGYLTGRRATVLPSPERQGTMGDKLGTVEKVRGGRMELTLTDRLHLGDRLKLLPPDDRLGAGMTVRQLTVGNKPVKQAGSGTRVAVDLPEQLRVVTGSAVYKLGGREEFALSDEAGRKRLAALRPAKAPLYLELAVSDDALRVQGATRGATISRSYPLQTSPARTTPLDEEILTRSFAKSGEHDFTLAGLTCGILPPVVIPPSRLNEIRRDFYAELSREVERVGRERRQRIVAEVSAGALPAETGPATEQDLLVRLAGAADLAEAVGQPQGLRFLLPLERETLDDDRLARLPAEARRRIVWELPALNFPGTWPELSALVAAARERGFTAFLLDNLGHFALFAGAGGLELLGGPWLHTMNRQAALAWLDMGLAEVTLSPEDDRENLRALLAGQPGLPARIILYTSLPLLISRVPLVGEEGQVFREEKGRLGLRFRRKGGLAILEESRDFSLLGHRAELKAMGLHRFRLDLEGCPLSSARGRELLQAALTGEVAAGGETTDGNYGRGLE